MEVEERVNQVLRQGQKDLQETRTKHKKELTKVHFTNDSFFFLNSLGQNHIVGCKRGKIMQALNKARENMQALT